MVANGHQAALRIVAIDAASGIGDNHGLNAHAGEHTNGKGDFLRGVALVEMNAALHGGHWSVANAADDQPSGMADGGGLREIGDPCVGNFGGTREFVGEVTEARTEDQGDAWAQLRFCQDEFGGAFGAQKFNSRLRRCSCGFHFWQVKRRSRRWRRKADWPWSRPTWRGYRIWQAGRVAREPALRCRRSGCRWS